MSCKKPIAGTPYTGAARPGALGDRGQAGGAVGCSASTTPPCATGERCSRGGRRAYPRASVPDWAGDSDVHWLYLFGEPDEIIPDADASFGTDIAALRAGCISVTPLSFAVGLSDLSPEFGPSLPG